MTKGKGNEAPHCHHCRHSLTMRPMGTLILIRHAQSQWNVENRFTGWTDVPLSDQGLADAEKVAKVLTEFHFDLAFTSALQRAQQTLSTILKVTGQESVPVTKDKALNERHYGDLQGLNKAETAAKYGQEQVKLWRRSYFTQPPNGESIADCVARVTPYFLEHILPEVKAGKTVLVAAHGNSLRPMLRYLEEWNDEQTAEAEIGLCTPYIYWFEGDTISKKEVREVPGIVTKGASTTEAKVETGNV